MQYILLTTVSYINTVYHTASDRITAVTAHCEKQRGRSGRINPTAGSQPPSLSNQPRPCVLARAGVQARSCCHLPGSLPKENLAALGGGG